MRDAKCVVLAVCTFVVSFSGWVFAGAEGGSYQLESLRPLDIHTGEMTEWSKRNASLLYPASGGFTVSESTPVNMPASKDNVGDVAFRLAHASYGMTITEQLPDFRIGEYCSYLPVSDPAQIDWVATGVSILASKGYENGQVFYIDSATNDLQRVLFTRGGTVSIDWKLRDGTTETRSYLVGENSVTRPYRIFWTESPFNAPRIDLSGKFVRLLGNPDLVNPVYSLQTVSQNPLNVISNVQRGVVFDAQTQTLRAYCRVLDEENRVFDGPVGQFVLAYYDSGAKDKYVGSIVVEVSGPDVHVIEGSVGDELRPRGGGYDIDQLYAYIAQGVTEQAGDPNAPYLYQHQGKYHYSPKDDAVFAIAPTDATVAGTGSSCEWKADIYWRSPDFMNTLWPFEEDWYLISWSKNLPILVTGDAGGECAGMFLPSVYQAEICKYADPAGIAKLTSSNEVTVSSEGRFMVKLVGDDNVWFLPMRSVSHANATYFDQSAPDWSIGHEVVLRGGSAAGTSSSYVSSVDSSLPGYIYEAGSKGRNWNPILYHEPKPMTKDDSIDDGSATSSTNGFEDLLSSIYLVNTASSPLEVWWYAKIQEDAMPEPVLFPALPQRYTAVWPEARDAHDIVLASQKGSAGLSYVCAGSALYYDAATMAGTVSNLLLGAKSSGLSFRFSVNVCPKAASFPTVNAGRLLSLCGNEKAVLSVSLDGSDGTALQFRLGDSLSWDLPVLTNEWEDCLVQFSPSAGTNGLWSALLFRNETLVCSNAVEASFVSAFAGFEGSVLHLGAYADARAATGVALDSICSSSSLLVEKSAMESTAQLFFSFDGEKDVRTVLGTSDRYAFDSASGRMLVVQQGLAMSPGAPSDSDGLVRTTGAVFPQVYANNDPASIGYNPNEEHAFLKSSDEAGSYIVYALRNDLNAYGASKPFVLAMYEKDGKGAMRAYSVVVSNSTYNALSSQVMAGTLMNGPVPLNLLDGFYNQKSFSVETSQADDAAVVYRDKYQRMWARRDGVTTQYNFYPVMDSFHFPSLKEQPAVGTLVGWMNCVGVTAPVLDDLTSLPPLGWRWISSWPADDQIPMLRVGQVLTTAKDSLPEVWNMLSLGVAYPGVSTNNPVTVIDPTVAQVAPLAISQSFPDEYAFTVGSSGTCMLRKGKYYFNGLPPAISERFYIDPDAPEEKRMVLVGQMISKNAGTSYLQLNVLSDEERKALQALCVQTGSAKTAWDDAVKLLAKSQVVPSVQKVVKRSDGRSELTNTYAARDHYGLVGNGSSSGYVTLVENDASDVTMVPQGTPVTMHVIKVLPELYAGSLIVQQDPLNKLSEKLNISYTEPFGDAADSFEFEWRKCEPPADGAVPTNYPAWTLYASPAAGKTDLLLGGSGASLLELVNTYYVMRYRARSGTQAHTVTEGKWSAWCGPTLAEGWVQRVLNNVTPFAQRMDDFYENATEISYTMPEQIGKPYRGDVALNNDNLQNIGLLELYQTVLNKAESLSLALGINDPNANKQLMEAASRLADLYLLLGADASSDAANPLVGVDPLGVTVEYELPTGAFCFENQVPTLLEENLALLRGRTASVAPNMTTYPYYNRLIWNFTKGITEGEVAYVRNYNIQGSDGEITVEQAAAQYPQGHGDAYGHFLSALKGYYRLLRNPSFSWGDPSMMEMLVADSIVNMDYQDEQKFADIATRLVQTVEDVVSLTARKTWRDQGSEIGVGYFDQNTEQAFGYGEWAVRGGLGAMYNWATVNSLLPATTNEAVTYFADKSIKMIDRESVPALESLASAFSDLQQTVRLMDSGMNPLGLSDNAIPFDIDPTELDKKSSHFEQILTRTERALENATTVHKYASKFGSRIKQILNEEGSAAHKLESFESSYKTDLIAIFGTPYSDDIGPGGTYDQGYDGPDLYHYNWMDTAQYGLSEFSLATGGCEVVYYRLNEDRLPRLYTDMNAVPDSSKCKEIRYALTSGGISVKPDRIQGVRRVEGKLQSAYRDFLQTYCQLQAANRVYSDAVKKLKDHEQSLAKSRFAMAQTKVSISTMLAAATTTDAILKFSTANVLNFLDTSEVTVNMAEDTAIKSSPKIVGAGLTVNVDPSAVVGAVAGVSATATKTALNAAKYSAKTVANVSSLTLETMKQTASVVLAGLSYQSEMASIYDRIKGQISTVGSAADALQAAYGKISAAEASYRKVLADGQALLEKREMLRKQQSNDAVSRRYADMFYRVQRNHALSTYNTAFDVAQRYVYLLSKVYDYETGLLSSDQQAGDSFLRDVVATCSLGEKGVSVTSEGSDGGLYDLVNRMKANWEILRGRLGVNNPDVSTKWFSLRYSLFRIDPGADGDDAWKRELEKYWCDDILSDSEFSRYCQPPASDTGLLAHEPGLIIPFSTSIHAAENFFGKSLLGGDNAFSSSDYATKIHAVGVDFVGYNQLVNGYAGTPALADEPNIYLVPVGADKMRTPGGDRTILSFQVVDQVLPLPYVVGSSELDSGWIASMSGLDGTDDSFVTIRKHSTMRVGNTPTSTRLVGRSVWNDRWLLIIPASALHSDREKGLKILINGADLNGDGTKDQLGISDIRLGIRSYSRSGN